MNQGYGQCLETEVCQSAVLPEYTRLTTRPLQATAHSMTLHGHHTTSPTCGLIYFLFSYAMDQWCLPKILREHSLFNRNVTHVPIIIIIKCVRDSMDQVPVYKAKTLWSHHKSRHIRKSVLSSQSLSEQVTERLEVPARAYETHLAEGCTLNLIKPRMKITELIEHSLTSPPTQYRLYGRRFFTGQKIQPTVSKY